MEDGFGWWLEGNVKDGVNKKTRRRKSGGSSFLAMF
jgi:hypothetical protein